MYKFGYVILEAVNETILEWKWIQNSNNEVYGRMVISQPFPLQPWILPNPPQPNNPIISNNNNNQNNQLILIIVLPIVFGILLIIVVILYIYKPFWFVDKLKTMELSKHSHELTNTMIKKNEITSDKV